MRCFQQPVEDAHSAILGSWKRAHSKLFQSYYLLFDIPIWVQIIQAPMCLEAMLRNLGDGAYPPDEAGFTLFVYHLRLIEANCIKFNRVSFWRGCWASRGT